MEMSNSKKERKRRIVERSSDRMALIKGQIQNLQSSTSSSPTFHYHTKNESSAPTFSSHDHQGPQTMLTYQINDNGNITQPLKNTSIVQKAANNAEDCPQPHHHHSNLFSLRQLNSCIIASEGTRSFCALMIALLVVLSYIDSPLFGRNIVRSEGVVASRPLYILLLADVTIVLARLYLEMRKEAEEERVIFGARGGNWTGAEKVLERGLVVYQTIRAVFIDCSVYVVVVICGLSCV